MLNGEFPQKELSPIPHNPVLVRIGLFPVAGLLCCMCISCYMHKSLIIVTKHYTFLFTIFIYSHKLEQALVVGTILIFQVIQLE